MTGLSKIGVALLFAGLAGCASSGGGGIASTVAGTAPPEAKAVVADLAAARWQLLIAGNVEKAYEYLSPGFRAIMPPNVYKARTKPGMWKNAKVDAVECEQDRCVVTVAITYSYGKLQAIETPLQEVWLREEGKWWFSPEK